MIAHRAESRLRLDEFVLLNSAKLYVRGLRWVLSVVVLAKLISSRRLKSSADQSSSPQLYISDRQYLHSIKAMERTVEVLDYNAAGPKYLSREANTVHDNVINLACLTTNALFPRNRVG